jgi:hypothetical protein
MQCRQIQLTQEDRLLPTMKNRLFITDAAFGIRVLPLIVLALAA